MGVNWVKMKMKRILNLGNITWAPGEGGQSRFVAAVWTSRKETWMKRDVGLKRL